MPCPHEQTALCIGRIFSEGENALVFPEFVARSVGTYTTRELTLDSEVPHSLTLRSLGSRRS